MNFVRTVVLYLSVVPIPPAFDFIGEILDTPTLLLLSLLSVCQYFRTNTNLFHFDRVGNIDKLIVFIVLQQLKLDLMVKTFPQPSAQLFAFICLVSQLEQGFSKGKAFLFLVLTALRCENTLVSISFLVQKNSLLSFLAMVETIKVYIDFLNTSITFLCFLLQMGFINHVFSIVSWVFFSQSVFTEDFATFDDCLLLGFMAESKLFGLVQSLLVLEVHGSDLVVVEQRGHCPFEETDSFEQVQNVQLLHHFLPARKVQTRIRPIRMAAEGIKQGKHQVRHKTEKVVLLKLVFLRIIRSEQVAANRNFKRVSVVNVDQNQADGDRPKQTPDVRQHFIDLLISSIIAFNDPRLEKRERTIHRIIHCYLIWIFQGKLIDYSSFLGPYISKGQNTLISCDPKLLHKENAFSSELLRKDNVVVILKIIGKIT